MTPAKQHTPPAKRTKTVIEALDDPRILEITVAGGKTFTIHRKLACTFSGYFRAMARNDFQETVSNTIDWREEDANLVRVFTSWLYTNTIDLSDHNIRLASLEMPLEYDEESKQRQSGHSDGKHQQTRAPTVSESAELSEHQPNQGNEKITTDNCRHHRACAALLKLWIFADRFDIPKLQDECINALHLLRFDKAGFRWRAILWAWENSTDNSRLRAYLVEWICTMPGPDINSRGVVFPHALSMAMIRRYRVGMPDLGKGAWRLLWATLDICAFHRHEGDVVCRFSLSKAVPIEKAKSTDVRWVHEFVQKTGSEKEN